jgi:predicted nuclease of predicted toxin-antitoxin system
VRLLLDENLSRRIVPLIASHYPGSSQVALLGLEQASDADLWTYARQHGFIIVTKDSDFADLSTLHGQPPKVILLKTGNQTWRDVAQTLIDQRDSLESALIMSNVACVDLH